MKRYNAGHMHHRHTARTAWDSFEKSGSIFDYMAFAAVRKNESEDFLRNDQAYNQRTDNTGTKGRRG